MKKLKLGLALWLALTAPVWAAGTINLSLSQQLDNQGKPLSGCFLYFFASGTTTPQSAYQDSNLSIPLPNPLRCDSAGRLPQFFLADGSIKLRLTNASGVTVLSADNLLVIGPSSGGGGGSQVDPTTVAQTGDIKPRYGIGNHVGWVRANGRTIGSASSGATERANADTQPLFEYLWTTDPSLAVTGGRGVSANADWTANKAIALPDWRGRTIAALDDLGNTAAGRLTAAYFGTSATVLGAAGGTQSHTLLITEIPGHTHTGTTSIAGNHSHSVDTARSNSGVSGGGGQGIAQNQTADTTVNGAHSHTFTTDSTGGGLAHPNIQPTMLATIYMKL